MNDTITPLPNGDFEVRKYPHRWVTLHLDTFTVCSDKNCIFYTNKGQRIAKLTKK